MTKLLHSISHFCDHDFGLVIREVWANRQAQDSVGKLLRNWKRASRPNAICVSAREMRRDGIMNQCSYATFCEPLLKRVAMQGFDDVKVPNRIGPVRNERKNQIMRLRQSFLVAFRNGLPSLVPFVELLEFDAKEGRLQLVEPRVVPFHIVVVL